MAKKKAAKKKKTSGARKCGLCGDSGHNARSCPQKEGTVATAESDDAGLTIAQPEDIIEFDTPAAPDPTKPPPGAPLNTPKRRRPRSKAEEAFFTKSAEKLAPGAVATAGELNLFIPRISTGNFCLDLALGGSVEHGFGWPQGRICRPWGLPKSAKSGSCWNTVASYQRNHCSECFQRQCDCKNRDVPEVLWIDAENRTADMMYWPEGHGVVLDCLRIMSPPSGQNVVDFVDHVIREQKTARIGLIIVDSIAHIVSQEVLNKATLDGVTVGRNAYLMNAAWQKWTSAVMSLGIQNARKPTILAINQIRHKVGQVFGSPEVMPGGIGQEFATSADIRFSRGAEGYVVWDKTKKQWVAKNGGYKGGYRPKEGEKPHFVQINFKISASGIGIPKGFGEFNYWMKSEHGHRIGDVDNGLQLWQYAKRHDKIEVDGHTKRLFGHEARTFDELEELFRADPVAQQKAWDTFLTENAIQSA